MFNFNYLQYRKEYINIIVKKLVYLLELTRTKVILYTIETIVI